MTLNITMINVDGLVYKALKGKGQLQPKKFNPELVLTMMQMCILNLENQSQYMPGYQHKTLLASPRLAPYKTQIVFKDPQRSTLLLYCKSSY